MPFERAPSIVVPIFKGKGDIKNCSCYRAVIVECRRWKREFEKRLHRIVTDAIVLKSVISTKASFFCQM